MLYKHVYYIHIIDIKLGKMAINTQTSLWTVGRL